MAIFRFKEEKQEEERPAISKRAMRRIIDGKDYEVKRARKDSEEWMHLAEEEKLMIIKLEAKLKKQKILTLLYGLSGIGLGAGITWLIL